RPKTAPVFTLATLLDAPRCGVSLLSTAFIDRSLAQHLADAGDAVVFVNTDDLGRFWPRPDRDRFNTALVERNLASLASNRDAR
ncbi:MAG TPA: hypothetical protein VES40_19865, partial [Ilumatobacteraceae bacterium]|nr:hypothetical protein [Ilumatobacteraceae bacterium]